MFSSGRMWASPNLFIMAKKKNPIDNSDINKEYNRLDNMGCYNSYQIWEILKGIFPDAFNKKTK